MSGRLTLWGAGEMLSSFFSRTATSPPVFYLALMKDIAPTSFVSGAELDEPQGGSYARAEIPNDAVYWSNESQPQVIMTMEDVSFITATEDWGIVRFWALCNAADGGYLYATGELASPYSVATGDVVVLGSGDLSVALGPFYSEES